MTDRTVETRLRVRYAETDQMGVVYYANYLVWMEVARTDFCRQSGFRYRDMEVAEGIAIAVVQVRCRYRVPARYDDEIRVRTTLERLKPKALDFAYAVENAETGILLAEGVTTHVAIDGNGRPRAIPEPYFTLLSGWVSS